MKNRNILITIIGPTAIGKTALSIALAKHYNCEIVSCDSRQFYKEMSVGTAVPSMEELNEVPHHFIQNKSIHEPYNVGDFEKECIKVLDSLFIKNTVQVAVGGSGLYVDALAKGLDRFPEVDLMVKTQVRNDFDRYGIDYLKQKLHEFDLNYFNYLSNTNPQTLQNPQRLMRFLEVCISSKKPYSSFLDKKSIDRNFTTIYVGLDADRTIIYNRINDRVDQMVANGLVEEAKKLHHYKNLNALQTVGYKEIFNFLDNSIPLQTAIDDIKKNTRRFAKRQLTWFKRTENVLWFDYSTSSDAIIKKLEDLI